MMQEQVRVESFVPALSEGVDLFSMADDELGFESPLGTFATINRHEKPFVTFIDGKRSLEEIIASASTKGQLLSTRALLQLIQKFAAHGCLTQSKDELLRYGFQPAQQELSLGRKLLHIMFNITVAKPGGRGIFSSLTPLLKKIPLGLLSLALVLTCSSLGASAFLLWGDLSFEGPPVKLGDSHIAGFLAIYLGGVFALTLRQVLRGWALAQTGLSPYAVGLELRLFLLAPHLDTRNSFRAGLVAQRTIAVAGLAGAALAAAMCSLGSTFDWLPLSVGSHGFTLACFGALAVLLGQACPLIPGDLGFLLDHMNDTGDGRKHAGSYVNTRYFKGLAKRDLFDGEIRLIALSLGTVLWIYLSFVLGARLIADVLLPSTHSILQADSVFDGVALIAFVGIVALTLAGILLTFILGLGGALLKSLPTPSIEPKSFTPDFSEVKQALSTNPLFVQLSEPAFEELAQQASAFTYRSSDAIIQEGDWGESFYMVSKGDVAVIHTAPSGVETTVATLHDGDSFGEMALVESVPRNATVKAVGEVAAYKVSRSAFLKALENAGLDHQQITTTLRATSVLRNSELFSGLSPCSLNKLLSLCSRKTVANGEILAAEGEEGDYFFIIESGAVQVEQSGESAPLAALGPGDFFGEIALLCNVPRTATVTTTCESTLLTLSREAFKEVVVHDFLAGIRLEQIAIERTGRGRA